MTPIRNKLYPNLVNKLEGMTPIRNKLSPNLVNKLQGYILVNIKVSLFQRITDQLYIQLYNAPSDAVEFELIKTIND